MTRPPIEVNVQLYDPTRDSKPRCETYNVPYVEGMRVLDALHYIHDHYNSSMAYRWECRAGQCGSCAMMINGKAGLACQTNIPQDAQEITVAPLSIFPVIRDLVVDVEKGVNKVLKIRPYVQTASSVKRPQVIYPYEIEDVKPLKECVECWACVSMCPVVEAAWDTYGGPVVMGHLARLSCDKRNVFDHLSLAFLEGLNACTQCGNCKEVCAKEIDIPEKAVGKLRYLAYNKRSLLREGHRFVLNSLKMHANPLDEFSNTRANWASDLQIPTGKREAEILYFVGCMASWREQSVARSTAKLLSMAGADFTILGTAEKDCGSVLFRINDLELAREFALYMKDKVRENKYKMIVTSCAGCFRTFRKDYPERLGIELGIPVRHSSEVFAEYIRDGRLVAKNPVQIKATYHDPCHLGRHLGVYDQPRQIAKELNVALHEMLNNRYKENARCCGAGGGVRSAFREVARDVAAYRVEVDVPKEAKAIIHTCPFCYFNFEDAVETRKFLVKNVDLTELLLMSVIGSESKKTIGDRRYDLISALAEKK